MVNLPRELQTECFNQHSDAVFTEYRHIGVDRPAIQEFRGQGQVVPGQKPDYSLYFGVLPRTREKKPMDHTHWLWGDFDNREDFLFTAIKGFTTEPDIIVDSGRGFQVYWHLAAPMPTDMASIVMKGIAKMHNGDNTHDAARILRVPGTINRKNGALARILVASLGNAHPWVDFLEYAEEGRPKPAPAHKAGIVIESGHRPMPLWLLDLIATDPGKGQRSEHAFRVVCAMIELGYGFEDIEYTFENNPEGVGAKYAEKGNNATTWLRTTYNNASQRI